LACLADGCKAAPAIRAPTILAKEDRGALARRPEADFNLTDIFSSRNPTYFPITKVSSKTSPRRWSPRTSRVYEGWTAISPMGPAGAFLTWSHAKGGRPIKV